MGQTNDQPPQGEMSVEQALALWERDGPKALRAIRDYDPGTYLLLMAKAILAMDD